MELATSGEYVSMRLDMYMCNQHRHEQLIAALRGRYHLSMISLCHGWLLHARQARHAIRY
jgi:hypothetical protein